MIKLCRKLALAAAALAIATSTAQAVEMPKLIAANAGGDWCYSRVKDKGREGELYMRRAVDGDCTGQGLPIHFAVNRKGFESEEERCTAVKVSKPRKIGRSLEWTITFRCTSIDGPGQEFQTIDVELWNGLDLTLWRR